MIGKLALLLLAVTLDLILAGPPDIIYEIEPIPREDRTELRISVSFIGNDAGSTRLILPRDRYQTPDMWRFVTEIEVEGAALSKRGKDDGSVVLSHEPGSGIRFTYLLSFDPEQHQGYAYRPSVGPGHFHFFGPQWLLSFPDRDDLQQAYRYAFMNVPDGWPVFSNLGAGTGPWEITASEDEISGFIAGGDYVSSRGDGVEVHIRGAFKDPQRIATSVQEIAVAWRRFFDDFSQSFYVVSISEREDIVAGAAVGNSFICLTAPTSTQINLEKLIAHEAIHYWLPGKANIVSAQRTGADEYRFDWFIEGFAEYCGRRILLDSGRATPKQYAQFFNADFREHAKNPRRRATLREVAKAIAGGTYTNRHERLNYVRGPLMALTWERELELEGKTTVSELVRAFVRMGEQNEGKVSEADFFDLFEQAEIDARGDYRRFIVDGEVPVPPADALGAEYTLQPNAVVARGGEEISSWLFVTNRRED